MILGANLILVVVLTVFVTGLIFMALKNTLVDFVKANFGMMVLLLLFLTVLGVTFHVFHESATNPAAKDFLGWLEGKAGEILASLLTLLVTVRAANTRSGESGATTPPPSTTPSSPIPVVPAAQHP